MTVSPFASQVKIDAALTALGADLIGQTEQQLLQQLVVAAATASGGGGGGGSVAFSAITGSPTDNTNLAAALNAKLPIVDPSAIGDLTLTGVSEGVTPSLILVTQNAVADSIATIRPNLSPSSFEYTCPAESGTLLTDNSIIQGTQLAETTVPTSALQNPGITINGTGVNLGGSITVTANLPAGGTTGQILAKQSNADGDADWETPPSLGPDVRLYTADATWDNPSPSTARRVFVRLVGGGGGGGSGRKGANSTVRCGGGGGAAGGVVEFWTLTTELGATRPVTIGAGGTGGAAQTSLANGNPGTPGGETAFASTFARGGNNGGAGGQNSGAAGAATAGTNVIGIVVANNLAGGAASSSGTNGSAAGATNFFAPTGGGAGAGLDAANANRQGGAGGEMGTAAAISILAGGSSGTGGGTAGGAGNYGRVSGTGGGGGGSSNAGAGGRGGNGGGFGAGGGGGAAGTDGIGDSGAGGNGAPGYALIITY